MLREIYREIDFISLNSPLVRESARESLSIFFDIYKPPVIVDEIQKVGQLFDYIMAIVDEGSKKGQFYLLSTQSLNRMKFVSESLAGRVGIIKMLGLSMREIASISSYAPFAPSNSYF